MLLEIIVFILLGLLAGTITGLIPGIHINLVGTILVSLSVSSIYFLDPILLVVFVVSMSITHTFVDFIPSIYLGAPDTDTELSILPGHELLMRGYGHAAVMLSAIGSLAAIGIIIVLTPTIFIIPSFFDLIKDLIPFILIVVSLVLVFSEKEKVKSLIAFLLAGTLGVLILNLKVLEVSEPLLPLLSGLFGASSIILSIRSKTKIPDQNKFTLRSKIIRPILGASIASPLCSFLPGLGSGQAAIIGNTISRTDRRGFLVLLGATNTIVMGFSFFSLYAISKTRTGSAAAIQKLMGNFSIEILLTLVAVVMISGLLSYFITKKLSEFFSGKINDFDYMRISFATLSIIILIVLIVTGIKGIAILSLAAITGIYIILQKVRRTNMMGALIIPTIIYYLF